MKSILLKTLAAASLVAAAQAEVHVLGVVWKERGLSAPDGTIDPNPGTIAATRGYMIFDESILTAAPAAGTLILYTDNRSGGSGPRRTYTIDSQFRGFKADLIMGATGGRRMYGHLIAPTSIADIPGSMIPFSGMPFASGYPKKLRLDDTVFQTGTATALTGPIIVEEDESTLFRSVLSGSATAVNVDATTIGGPNGAVAELEARLDKAGYSRAAVVPVIVTDLPTTPITLQDGETEVLGVTLGPDVFPTPTYQWFKDGVQVATTPTLTVVGGAAATGAGTYRVEVTTSAGTAVSGNAVVTATPFTFATNLPAAVPLFAQGSAYLSVVLDPTPITQPTYQWFKNNTAISATVGGTDPTLVVVGGEALTGAGTYRVEVTSSAGTLVSANSTVTVTAAAGANFTFTVNTPRTFAAPFAPPTAIPGGTVNPGFPVGSIASRQWSKAPTSDPTNFTAIPVEQGGGGATFEVVGNIAASNGPGVYRLVVTNTTGGTITSVPTVVTSGP